jgi:hypothetical protein
MKKLYCLILVTLVSCSSIHPIQRSVENTNTGVELELNSDNTQNPNQTVITKEPESIRIGEKGGEVFSNTNPELNYDVKPINKKVRIGLAFGPGLNRVFSYIEILKEIEKQNIKIELITGTEMGAVIAGLYASGITPEMIEWMFFKYFKENKNIKAYESEWIKEVDQSFLMKIKNSKIEEAKPKLFLTLFDHKTQKTYYFDKGNIRDLLLLNLRLASNPLAFKNGPEYSGAFEKEVFNSKLMNNLGCDFTIAIDSLTPKISFQDVSENEKSISVLEKVSSKIKVAKKSFDFVFTLPVGDMNLDSNSEHNVKDYIQKQFVIMRKKIQSKVDLLNANEPTKE